MNPPGPDASARPRRGARGRSLASAVCLALAGLLVPVAIVTAWARVQLVDEDAFARTLAPLASDPSVQALVIDESLAAIDAQVDLDALTGAVFDGIVGLGIDPRAASALALLTRPAADALRALIADAVTDVVESPAFASVWETTTRAAHRALTTAATSDGGGVVVREGEDIGIRLGPIVDAVSQRLVEAGVGVAALIPPVDRTVIVGSGESLAALRSGYALVAALGWWIPAGAVALLVAGLALTRRRAVGLIGSGSALLCGAAVLGVVLAVGADAVARAAGDLALPPAALGAVYAGITGDMARTALVVAGCGVALALAGWVLGRRHGDAPAAVLTDRRAGASGSSATR